MERQDNKLDTKADRHPVPTPDLQVPGSVGPSALQRKEALELLMLFELLNSWEED
jgi:hypothetical protein